MSSLSLFSAILPYSPPFCRVGSRASQRQTEYGGVCAALEFQSSISRSMSEDLSILRVMLGLPLKVGGNA